MHLHKGVIVDTSRDFVFQSPTFDFVLGAGRNIPQPTEEECTHILLALTEELSRSGVLRDIIGNRPIFRSDANSGIWELEKGLEEWRDKYQGARALEVVSWSESSILAGTSAETCKIYVGIKGRTPYWFFLRFYNHRSAQSGTIECYEMDEDSMIRIFSAYRWAQSVSGLPRRILAELVELVDKTLKDKQERVEKMRGSLSKLREVSARLDSAEYDKTTSRGDGIEN